MTTKSILWAQAEQEAAMARLAEVRSYLSEQVTAFQATPEGPVDRRDADLWVRLAVWYSTLSQAMHAIDPRHDEAQHKRPFLRLVEEDS